jgi:hypothetical protein
MADYHPLILRAVEGLDKNTGENRRALYERARTALVAQLRGVVPPLDESEITRERLALEEAIRKVEAESARRAREEPRRPPPKRPDLPPPRREEPPRAAPPAPPPPPPAPPAPEMSWADLSQAGGAEARDAPRERPATEHTSLTDEAFRGFRDAMSGQPNEPARPPARPPSEQPPASPPPAERSRQEMRRERESLYEQRRSPPQHEQPEDQWAPPPDYQEPPPSFDFSEPPPPSSRPRRPEQRNHEEPPEPRRSRAPGSYRKLAWIAAIALIGVGLGALAWWQRDAIGSAASDLIALVSGSDTPAPRGTTTPQQKPKITDRLGQPQTQPSGQPAVAQRVVLYEEDPNDPQGKRLLGTAVWRTEMMAPAPGRPAELAVRADVDIPERKMTMTWSLRRNADASLPASHTIEIMFNLPQDAPSGGVQNVPGVLMKQAEQTRGVPLAGLAVKVTPGFFLIGLSALEADMQRNIQLLKERAWFDIPMVYANNRRAILAMEKGTPGERAFSDAFAAWKQ